MPTRNQAKTIVPEPEPTPEPRYWVIFVLLAIFTALEVGAVSFTALTPGVRIGILVFLAVVKVALVLLYFMHLRFDRRVFALPFALGVVLIVPLVLVMTLTMNVTPVSEDAKALGMGGQVVEVKEVSFRIHLSQDKVQAGPVTFHIVNGADDMLHEFIIVQTDDPATDLPLDPVTSRVNEDAITIVTAQDNIEPAHGREITLNMDPGHYVLICNLPGHYLQGMMVDFEVVGSSNQPASTPEQTGIPPTAEEPSGGAEATPTP